MRHKIIKVAHHTGRWLWAGVLLSIILLSAAYITLRIILPDLLSDKARIERYLGELSGHRIEITSLQPHWDGVHPGVSATGVRIYGLRDKRASLAFDELRVSLALKPLLSRRVDIYRLVVVRPSIRLERLADGRLRVGRLRPIEQSEEVSAPEDGDRGGLFWAWLTAQHAMSIEDGVFEWVDRQVQGTQPVTVHRLNLSLVNNGNRHRLRFEADFPKALCQHCRVDMEIEGNPFVDRTHWGGRIYVEARQLDIDHLPPIIAQQLPEALSGRLDISLHTRIAGGILRIVKGQMQARDLRMPLAGQGKTVRLGHLFAQLRWYQRQGDWQLDLEGTNIGFGNESLYVGNVHVDHSKDVSAIRVERAQLGRIIGFARYIGAAPEVMDRIAAFGPDGLLRHVMIRLDRREQASSPWQVATALQDISVKAHGDMPGIKGLSAHVAVNAQSGELQLHGDRVIMLDLPKLFAAPMRLRSLAGQVNWQNKSDHWEIVANNLHMVGDGTVDGGLLLRLPKAAEQSPYIKLHARLGQLNARHVSRYLPVTLTDKLRAWLAQAFLSGRGVDGVVQLEGALADFPFSDRAQGRFMVRVDLEDAVFSYLPKWMPMTNARASLLFDGPSMLITAHEGRLGSLQVREVMVRKDDLRNREEPVRISARVIGPVQSGISILREAPWQAGAIWPKILTPDVSATGNGALSLLVELPYGQLPQISGEYRFLGGSVQLPLEGFRLSQVYGGVEFTKGALDHGAITAQLFGAPAEIDIRGGLGDGRDEVRAQVTGGLTAEGLAVAYGEGFRELFRGATRYQGEVYFRGMLPFVTVRSDLAGLGTVLPAPYDKLQLPDVQTIVETSVSTPGRHVMRLSVSDRIGGIFEFKTVKQGMAFHTGRVLLGNPGPELGTHPGLEIALHARRLVGDKWADFIRKASESRIDTPALITRFGAHINYLELYGYALGRLDGALDRSRQGWRGSVDGDLAQGMVEIISTGEETRVLSELEYLRWPMTVEEATGKQVKPKPEMGGKGFIEGIDPRDLLTMGIKARHFSKGKLDFGALDFWASHTDLGWRIMHANLERPAFSLRSSGSWYRIGERDNVEIKGGMRSADLGGVLEAMGMGRQMRKGKTEIKFDMRWQDPGEDIRAVVGIQGTLSGFIRDGSVLKVDNGAVRIASIFNYTSLFRFLLFDFSPMASGFPFDEMAGRIAINNGTVYSDGFGVRAPAAEIMGRGRINLVREIVDMQVDIYPNFRGAATVGTSLLWGPQTAAIVLLFQEAFKKKIAEGTRISYKISGPLAKPKIDKTKDKIKKKDMPEAWPQ